MPSEKEDLKVVPVMSSLPFSPFDPNTEGFDNFVERLNSYFRINGVDGKIRVDYLCVLVGAEHYALLKNILAPKKVSESTYEECVKSLKDHYSPSSRAISETFKFHSRKQQEGESVLTFITDIKKLSTKCDFGDFLDRALRDQLVIGLRDKAFINRLLLEDSKLTFDRACEIVMSMESANQSASNIVSSQHSQGEADVFAIKNKKSFQPSASRRYSKPQQGASSSNRKSSNKRCAQCFSKHSPDQCPAHNWMCYKCNKKGHTSQVFLILIILLNVIRLNFYRSLNL